MAKPGIYQIFERYIRHPSEQARLSIAQLLTNINKFVKFPPAKSHLLRWIIPTLIKSLKSPFLQVKAQSANTIGIFP